MENNDAFATVNVVALNEDIKKQKKKQFILGAAFGSVVATLAMAATGVFVLHKYKDITDKILNDEFEDETEEESEDEE